MKFLIPMLSLALGACAVTPPPPTAAPAAPTAWVAKLPEGGPPSADGWARFDDPLLAALISQADGSNPGLQQVLARIEQARALARQAGSAQLPQLAANGFVQRSRAAQPGGQPVQTLSSASLDAGWEIDLFGRARQQASAAQARAEASVLDAKAARLSLAAEVALNYLSLRACERLAQISQADAATAGNQRLAGRVTTSPEARSPATAEPSSVRLAKPRLSSSEIRVHCRPSISSTEGDKTMR